MLRLSVLLICALAGLSVGACATLQRSGSIAEEEAWVHGGSYRLQMRVYRGDQHSEHPVLLVVLHGDAPHHEPNYHYTFAQTAANNPHDIDVVAVGLLRPGYTDREGNTSDGQRGLSTGDNWNAQYTDAIADAIGQLQRRWKPRKVVVAGHSGGAALCGEHYGTAPRIDRRRCAGVVSVRGR